MNDIKINWKKYVDQIYCITFPKNDKTYLYKELKRLDIFDSGIYHEFENISTPLYKKLYDANVDQNYINSVYKNIITDIDLSYTFRYDVTMAHYYCMKNAQMHNYQRIMVLEEDAIFLKDKNDIINLLENIYNCFNENTDATIILGGVSHSSHNFKNDFPEIRNTLYQCSKEVNYDIKKAENGHYMLEYFAGGSTCNFYNKKAYDHFIKFNEEGKFGMADLYFLLYGNSNVNIFYTDTMFAIQDSQIGTHIYASNNHNVNKENKLDYLNRIFECYKSPFWLDGDKWVLKLIFNELNNNLFNNELTEEYYYEHIK